MIKRFPSVDQGPPTHFCGVTFFIDPRQVMLSAHPMEKYFVSNGYKSRIKKVTRAGSMSVNGDIGARCVAFYSVPLQA
jgi:hypothetical protein